MNSIDVVIPAFNAAPYIGEAIASVLAQSPAVSRVIVVDDGSADATASVAEGFGAPVEVVRLGDNRGAGCARNAGLAGGSSALVAFLDADDRWLAGKLAAQCAALAADPAAMFALCRIRTFASPELSPGEQTLLVAANPSNPSFDEGWLASALVARRELFAHVGLFPEDLRIGEAIDWFSRARVHPHVHVDTIGVERRLHRSNTTRRAPAAQRDYLLAARRHLTRTREGGLP